MKNKKSVICVVAAGILWGVISIFVKQMDKINAIQIATGRMFVGTVVMFCYILISNRNKLKIKIKDIWMFLCLGIVSIVFFSTAYFYAMQKGEVSVAVVLLYTSPVFVMLMSMLFFKEKINLKKIIALVLTISGCVLVSGVLNPNIKINIVVILAGLAAGFFYATYTIFGRIALKKYDTMTVTFYTFLTAFIALLPISNVGNIVKTMENDKTVILAMVGMGVVSTVLPYVLYTKGLEKLDPGVAAIIVAVEPVMGCVLGIFAYGEDVNIMKICGIIAVISSIVILNMGGKNEKG